MDERFKSAGISVEYGKIESLTSSDLDGYAARTGCGTFERNLDDDVLTNYFVIPLKFRNFTRNPVGQVRFVLDAGCPAAKLIDVRYAVLAPISKRIVVRHDLPELKWTPSTNVVVVKLGWDYQPGAKYNVYGSVAGDRGFGQMTPTPSEGYEVPLPFVPNRNPSRYYFRGVAQTAWGESEPSEVISVPIPRYLQANFKPLNESTTNDSQISIRSGKESMPFLEGRTTISFDTGLDPAAVVAIYILGKVAPKESIRPSVKMDGEPGVLFKEMNPAPRFAMPGTELLNRARLDITPLQVRAVSASDKVVLFWDASTCSNYNGVKVFRSRLRPIGDYANVGDKVFDGYGSTNAFELEHIPEASQPLSSSGIAPNFQRFFDHAPPDLQPVVATTQRAAGPPRPTPPGNLKARLVEKVEGFTHFTDAPPERDFVFTYTLYAFDRAGNQSYPVVVNAVLDSASTNCTLKLLP